MIDLAKLKAFELPKIEKEIFLMGEKQTVTISAMKQTTNVKFAGLDENNPADKITLFVYILSDALGISEEYAKKLCDIDIEAATEIVSVCSNLTKEYTEKQKAEREQAEKNLPQAQEANTPQK